MRRETCLAAQEMCDLTFHCVSRVVDRAFKLGPKERSVFVKMMREYEFFCGVEVLAHCVMSNHVHLLVRVTKLQDAEELSDELLLERLAVLYKPAEVALVAKALAKYRKNNATKAARELRERYSYRMGDISEFMKSLKQKFSRWYNKANARTGTLWEDRYSVSMVGPGWSTKVVAAYIDLNPLRAGMVNDPGEYRWSGYGEAVAGKKLARQRLMLVMESVDDGATQGSNTPQSIGEALAQYRMLLADEGQAEDQERGILKGESKMKRVKRAKGFSKREAQSILDRGGKLSMSQLLRSRTRYFIDSGILGSQSFVEEVLGSIREKTGQFAERKSGASKIKHGGGSDKGGLYSLRKLQKDVVDFK